MEQTWRWYRPTDHGHTILYALKKKTNQGYSAISLFRGESELRGQESGIEKCGM